MQIGQFARFAQNYAVRVSDFVRKINAAGLGDFPLISQTFAMDAFSASAASR